MFCFDLNLSEIKFQYKYNIQSNNEIYKTNNYMIGNNVLCNRLYSINKRVDLNLLNLP